MIPIKNGRVAEPFQESGDQPLSGVHGTAGSGSAGDDMTDSLCKAAVLAFLLAFTSHASARGPAPLVPTALVEDIKSKTTDVEFMDYVGAGQVIKLEPRDVLVLSYLKSCAHETITGGTVRVGSEKSDVDGGKIVRTKVACDGGKIQLTSQQASASGASAFRLQSAAISPTLHARSPMIQIPKLQEKDSRTLVIERTDRRGERFEIAIGELAGGSFYDMAKADKPLTRGAVYNAQLGPHKVTFKIHGKAKSGKTPVVSRLLRFQS